MHVSHASTSPPALRGLVRLPAGRLHGWRLTADVPRARKLPITPSVGSLSTRRTRSTVFEGRQRPAPGRQTVSSNCGSSAPAPNSRQHPRHRCFAWFGKTLTVVTDGRFRRSMCPKLNVPDVRVTCVAGARAPTSRSGPSPRSSAHATALGAPPRSITMTDCRCLCCDRRATRRRCICLTSRSSWPRGREQVAGVAEGLSARGARRPAARSELAEPMRPRSPSRRRHRPVRGRARCAGCAG